MAILDLQGNTLSAASPPIATNPNADLAIKAPVRVATTGSNINLQTIGLGTIDGVSLAAGDRILVKDQTDATMNGLYNAATGPWTRTIDANNNSLWTTGTLIAVAAGTANAGNTYKLTTAIPVIVGTSLLTFALVSLSSIVGANPAAKVGLTTVNGTAATAMRSDGAPPLDQSITPTWTGAHTWSKSNTVAAITLTAPDSTSATFDSTPLAALEISAPPTAWTRNFLCALHVTANGATTDKGRGVIIQNNGASDGIYIQQDGVGATGLAILNQTDATNATGQVIGVTLSSQIALDLRQEIAILAGAASATLLQVEANGSATEMARFNSTVASQVGIVFRMFGAGSQVLAVKNNGGTTLSSIDNGGGSTWGSINVPLLIGGTGTTGVQQTFQTTTGLGTTDSFTWKGGNNGGTTFATLAAAGLGIGIAPTYKLQVSAADADPAILFSGATKGIRFGFNASDAFIEGVDSTGIASFQPLVLGGSQVLVQISGTTQFQVSGTNSVVLGNAAIGTSATDGFLYVVTCAGTPTGVPTTVTGRVALVYDTTNHQFWIYDGGWKQPKTPAAASIVTWQ